MRFRFLGHPFPRLDAQVPGQQQRWQAQSPLHLGQGGAGHKNIDVGEKTSFRGDRSASK